MKSQLKSQQKSQKASKATKKVAKKVTKTTKRTKTTVAKKTAQKAAVVAPSMAKAFAATKPARRMVVNWNKAKSPFAKAPPAEFVAMQGQLDAMWSEVYSAPQKVEDIDFTVYEAKIKDKAAVAALKAEYESVKFVVQPSLFQSAEAAAAKVKAAESEATFMRDSAASLKSRIKQLETLSTIIPFMSLEQQINLTPGLDEEFDRQLSNFHQLTDKKTLNALDVDTTKITEALEAGNLPEVPAEAINRIMYTPVYFAAINEHDTKIKAAIKEKYGLNVPCAKTIIGRSLKRQNALPSIEQVNQHLDELQLPFVLTALKPEKSAESAFKL